jgi:hypothetical protein
MFRYRAAWDVTFGAVTEAEFGSRNFWKTALGLGLPDWLFAPEADKRGRETVRLVGAWRSITPVATKCKRIVGRPDNKSSRGERLAMTMRRFRRALLVTLAADDRMLVRRGFHDSYRFSRRYGVLAS